MNIQGNEWTFQIVISALKKVKQSKILEHNWGGGEGLPFSVNQKRPLGGDYMRLETRMIIKNNHVIMWGKSIPENRNSQALWYYKEHKKLVWLERMNQAENDKRWNWSSEIGPWKSFEVVIKNFCLF